MVTYSATDGIRELLAIGDKNFSILWRSPYEVLYVPFWYSGVQRVPVTPTEYSGCTPESCTVEIRH
jgi:hypothetical protein